MLQAFDHVNVKTSRLEEMVAWYADVLGMHAGSRPDFGFPGAWLYLGDQALVHLVGTSAEPQSIEPRIEHFALRATGLAGFLERLKENGVEYRLADVPGFGILQVNIHDPDGNHIHIDFDAGEPRS